VTTTATWLELSIAVDQEAGEEVAALFARYGYQGGVVVEPSWLSTEEGDAGGTDHLYDLDSTRPVTVRTYLPADGQAAEIQQHLATALWHLGQMRPVGQLQTRTLVEEDWAHNWKQYYQVQRIGQRIVIVPSWLEYAPQPADLILKLDPGMAFGTGLHPTTRLCLRLLEQHVLPGQQILDLGTGSGILAIAAAKLNEVKVEAFDLDAIAVAVASENVVLNQVADQVQVVQGGLETNQKYDLVVANIIASVLINLAPALAQVLNPGGTLLSSGIILARETEVTLALAAAGLEYRERHQEGEWVALVHSKLG